MIGQALVQIITQVPADAQPIRDGAHQQPLGADILEEHGELQLKEDDWVDGWSPPGGIKGTHEIADEGKVERALEMAVEVVSGDQVLQRDVDKGGRMPALLCPSCALPSSPLWLVCSMASMLPPSSRGFQTQDENKGGLGRSHCDRRS